MRSWAAIIRATAREVLSEPLSLLILISSQALAVLAPAFHYHQFGEATRMARDAGFSALFLGGGVMCIFATIRAIRREIESGTLAMALVHPIARRDFLLAKFLGCLLAYLAFAGLTAVTMLMVVWGADIGGAHARQCGELARIYGPCLAAAMAMLLLPLVSAALLNRFGRFRFVTTVFAVAAMLTVPMLGTLLWFRSELVVRYLPALGLLAVYSAALASASAAAAVRFRANAAASAVGLVFLASVPAIGNYYLADALAKGGTVAPGYAIGAVLAALPAIAAFLVLGIRFMNGRDI